MSDAHCTISRRSRRAGRSRSKVALGTRPMAGAVLAAGKPVEVKFGAVPPLPKHCRLPFGGRRVASSRTVLAYSYTDYDPDYPAWTVHYGACLRPQGRLHAITTADVDESVEDAAGFRTAGHFVAYSFASYDKYGDGFRELRLYDVRRARQLFHRNIEQYDSISSPSPTDPRLGEYVVSKHGALAWLRVEGSTTQLFARPRPGGVRELDSGGSLSGLSFSGDTLSWTSGSGERKSAEVR